MTPFLLLSKSATWSLEKPLHESFLKPPFHLSKPHHPITTNHHHTSCGKLPGMELLSKVSGQTHVNINFFDIKVILLIIYKPFVKKIYPNFFSTFRYFSRASPFFYLPTFGKLRKITSLTTFRSLPSFSLARLAPCSSSSAELTRRKGGFLLATEKNDVAIVTQGWCLFFLNVGRKVHIFTYLQENDWRGIVVLFCVPRWWGFCWSKLLRNMVCIKKAKYFLPTESTFVSMRLRVVSTWSRFFAKQATKTIPCNFFSMLHKFTCFYVERTQECDEPVVI